ncbi:hypothetical protein LCGC14_2493030, partial [marine sediment metagenome]
RERAAQKQAEEEALDQKQAVDVQLAKESKGREIALSQGLSHVKASDKGVRALYVSTKFLNLKIIKVPSIAFVHPVTKVAGATKGEAIQFKNGRLILNNQEDIDYLDARLAGVPGLTTPPGVKKISSKAEEAFNSIKQEKRGDRDIELLEQVEGITKGRGRQGTAG